MIRPSKIELGTFSCYHNFVEVNKIGAPNHSENYGAIMHLNKLLTDLEDNDQNKSFKVYF